MAAAHSDESEPAAQPPAPQPDESRRQPPLVHSQTLFQGAQELLIQHGEQVYRLRQTRNGKLILNK